MDQLLISIIIPVYNVKNYLPVCLESILLYQNFKSFEVILVDDGSTDGSSKICDEYEQNDSRVKVIHKQNGGASSARNAGLKAAAGKYIMFVDGDDYIEKHSLEQIAALIKAQGDSDVIFLNASGVFPDGVVKVRERFQKVDFYKKSQMEVLKRLSKKLPDCLWDKLIRRAVLEVNNITFTDGIICEDVDFVMELFMHAESYNTTDFIHYYYREQREGSIMNTPSEKLFSSLLFILNKWTKLAETQYNQFADIINSWNGTNFCWSLIPRYNNLSKESKNRYKARVDELKWLLIFSDDINVKIIRLCYHVFGLELTSALMNFYYRSQNDKR